MELSIETQARLAAAEQEERFRQVPPVASEAGVLTACPALGKARSQSNASVMQINCRVFSHEQGR